MTLSELLFLSRKTPKIECVSTVGCDEIFLNMSSEPGEYSSAARPRGKEREKAKISRIARLFDKLLIDKSLYIANINNGESGYAEYRRESDNRICTGVYDGDRLRWLDGMKPDGFTASLAPIFAYVVGKKSHTFKMFDEIKTILGINPAKTIPVDKMYLICDAFYYEFAAVKKAKGEDEIDDSDVLTYDEIDQINRVRSAESLFDGGMTSNYIKVTPSSDDTVEKYDDYIEKVKNGEMIVGYQWSDAQQEKIPDMSFLDSFVPTTEYVELCDMVYTNMSAVVEDMANDVPILDTVKAHHVNSILLGKPGTGKTSIAYALGAAFQMPVYTVINSKNIEEDNFEGKNKVINGEITFCSTPFLEAFKNGGIVVLEEFNLAAPDVIMGALGQAVEAPFILFEDGYKEVRRHPLCVILATMNVGTSGSKEPSEAFVSRFPEVYILNDPNEKDFVNILMSSGSSEVDCHNVYDAYSSVQMHLEDKGCDDIALSLTMRHCFAALKALGRGIPFKKAVQKTIINAIGVKDLELAREVYETVIEPMVLKSA